MAGAHGRDGEAEDPAQADRERRQAERARRRLQPRSARRARRRRRRALRAASVAGIVAVVAFAVIRVVGGDPTNEPAASGDATDVAAQDAPTFALGPTVSDAAARRTVIPILMYHVIATPAAGTPYPDLWVPPAAFRAQMFALARAGYRGITLSQAFAGWREGAPVPAQPVVVSFDDGYRSHSTVAAPVLRELGWPGVLNLEIGNVGSDGISLGRLRGLVRDGWKIHSHTVHHPDLTALGPAELRGELTRSRAWVRRRLGVDAIFCYPAGRFDATVVTAVRTAGYRGATTTQPGPATAHDDPYELPRIRVTSVESAGSLLAAVASVNAGGRTRQAEPLRSPDQ